MSTNPTPAATFPTTFPAESPLLRQQFQEALKYRDTINAAAKQIGVAALVICGIGSRESHWGLILHPAGPAGTGDFTPRTRTNAFRTGPMPPDGLGFGRGLMQIDFDAQEFARTGNWRDAAANINKGCEILKGNLDFIAHRTQLTGSAAVRAAIAAYNCGAGNVLKAIQSNQDVDTFTANHNYSADVLNRAGWFQVAGW